MPDEPQVISYPDRSLLLLLLLLLLLFLHADQPWSLMATCLLMHLLVP